jgi:hypothetical protein
VAVESPEQTTFLWERDVALAAVMVRTSRPELLHLHLQTSTLPEILLLIQDSSGGDLQFVVSAIEF